MSQKEAPGLHSVLRRQLRKCGADPDHPPAPEQWKKLIQRIDQTYQQAEQDRYLLERSLDISSNEMQQLYERLKESSASELAEAHARLQLANEELLAARDEAIRANEAKSTFLANMSHELRTPLNAIIGYSEMLVEDFDLLEEHETLEDLKKILGSANHLLSLINNILDLSKIEAGKFELFLETFDIAKHIHGMLNVIAPLIEKNNNHFALELAPQLGQLHTDPLRLGQILINLLTNASKFTKQGRISLQVQRHMADGKEWVTYAVKDTGIGIAADKLEQLFSPFVQVPNAPHEFGGTGLGLTISKHFSEEMGGELTAESEPGVGSCFTVKLPVL